jgi:hypothetical protein
MKSFGVGAAPSIFIFQESKSVKDNKVKKSKRKIDG